MNTATVTETASNNDSPARSSKRDNFLIIAGEASADRLAADVIRELKRWGPEWKFWGAGGPELRREGCETLYDIHQLALTGFGEVLKHIRFFREVMATFRREIRQRRPRAALLVDYPGLNMRLGPFLKELGIPVFYYVSPQVWAWRAKRVEKLAQFVRHMFVILPFEEEIYREVGVEVTFVGHPLLDRIREPLPRPSGDPQVAFLPGSRRNELERHLPVLEDLASLLHQLRPEIKCRLALLPELPLKLYQPLLSHPNVMGFSSLPEALDGATTAVVASGTATLETALYGVPLVVIYKTHPLTYWLGKLLVQVEHLALPNLIAGDRLVPELIQHEADAPNLLLWALNYIDDAELYSSTRAELLSLRRKLGSPGAGHRVAQGIVRDLNLPFPTS